MSSFRDFSNMGSPSKYFWQQLALPRTLIGFSPLRQNVRIIGCKMLPCASEVLKLKEQNLATNSFLLREKETSIKVKNKQANKPPRTSNICFSCQSGRGHSKAKVCPDNCADSTWNPEIDHFGIMV